MLRARGKGIGPRVVCLASVALPCVVGVLETFTRIRNNYLGIDYEYLAARKSRRSAVVSPLMVEKTCKMPPAFKGPALSSTMETGFAGEISCRSEETPSLIIGNLLLPLGTDSR